MLESIRVENIAVIKSLEIEFGGGFTVFTGETGAGKSIIIDSIMLTLGAKAQPQLIRTGESTASVTALFRDIGSSAKKALAELGIDAEDGEVTISRTMHADGKSSAKINGKSVSLANLRRAASPLISVNGQSESLSLRTPASQLDLLDSYAGCEAEFADYQAAYGDYVDARAKLDEAEKLSREGALASDLLSYQIKEIDAAKLTDGEEEELTMELARIKSREKTAKLANFVYRAAYGNEKGASAAYLSERAASVMDQLREFSPDAGEDAEKLRSIAIELEDIARRTYDKFELGGGAVDDDPEARLEEIEDRLDIIRRLKRKYGGSIEKILRHRDEAAEKLDLIENNESRTEELKAIFEAAEKKACVSAEVLSEKRRNAADEMSRRVCEVLFGLDMPKVTFSVRFEKTELSPTGNESAEFYISANAGEDERPLALAASGGELSRVMLAIKSVVTSREGEDTIIYDEIDTGVSGATSGKIGRRLKASAETTQIICVTHSAQIAALSNTHYLVKKSVENGRTETTVRALSGEERVDEIARIIGGINVTATQRKAALELIAEGGL
ncbi:MAG: DNA repair protein RecN [Clostridiales bacterium]|nr:DNA repair protein RecN [Clostridiales bacterium]